MCVVVADSACHAGGRGFESRRPRLGNPKRMSSHASRRERDPIGGERRRSIRERDSAEPSSRLGRFEVAVEDVGIHVGVLGHTIVPSSSSTRTRLKNSWSLPSGSKTAPRARPRGRPPAPCRPQRRAERRTPRAAAPSGDARSWSSCSRQRLDGTDFSTAWAKRRFERPTRGYIVLGIRR